MPSTVYRGDLAEVTMGRETGLVITAGAWGGLDISVSTSGDVSTLTFSGTSGHNASYFFDSSHQLKYPKGLLVGSTLKMKSSAGSFAADDYSKGRIYTIIENGGTSIKVTPAMKAADTFTDATCDYNNDPTITMDSTASLLVGMSVKGTGIPAGATVASITDSTTFELSASTTGGSVTNGTLTFSGSIDGDALLIDALGTPTIDVGMTYNSSAAASDESVLTDQFVGLAATVTLPETKTEIFRSHVVGIGRDVVVQAPQKISNEGGSLETMMHSARWLYYALGNEAVKSPSNTTVVDDGTNVAAIGMGDSYISLTRAGNGAVTGSAPAVGDYVVVVDTTESLTPYTDEEDGDNDATLEVTTFPTDSETQFRSVQRNEIRRVVALDTTAGYYRIYVDSPFNFDHAVGKALNKIVLAADNSTGTPHFETTDAAWGNIQNRQTRALFSMWRQPTFSLETSMRTSNVGSYSGESSANVPGGASDSQQLTRIYKGCKVKSWEMTADADAEVKLKVDFDALMCYTDTGRLENSNKGDRFTAHRMFENTANNKITRKTSGIAPNTEKPFFFYNGTITAFNTTMAQVTKFKVTGNNNTQTIYTVGAQPLAESRNTAGQSLEQIPFAGSRNATLNVEGKVEYECSMEVIVTDPLLWHEFRTNREHLHDEPITLHLVKNGAGASREAIRVIIDDYIISDAPMQIPDDKSPIKSELTVMPKHVKVVAYDALLHC